MTALSLGLSAARRLMAIAVCALAGIAVGIVIAAVGPYAVGHRSFTVMSGSMEPTIDTGDVVVVRSIAPLEANVGDVLTFRDPTDGSRLVTHRLRKARARGKTAVMVTKGDANNTPERWAIPIDGNVGQVQYRIPYIGHAVASIRGRGPGFFLLLLPVLLLGVYELVRLWRPERPERVKRRPRMPIDNCAE
jgi:signal peptidase I